MVKCLSTMRETWVWSLGQEDPLEKEMASHASILAWKIPWTADPGRLQSMRSQRAGHDWATSLFTYRYIYISSVQFICSVMSDSLQPHGLQHTSPPCPSPTPGVYSNSRPLRQCCHLTIPSSAVPFPCLQSFPESRSFQMSQLFAWGGQSIGVSASTTVLPMNTQD